MRLNHPSVALVRRRLTPRGGRRGRPRFAFETLEARLALALHIENFSDDFDLTQPGFDSSDADPLTVPGGDTDADPNTTLGPDEFLIPHQTSSGQVFFLFREDPSVASFALGISGVGDWYETNFAANRNLPGGLAQDEVAAVGIEFFGAGTILFVGENGVKTVTTRNWSNWDRVTVTSNDPSDSGAEMGPIERVLVTVDATSVPRGMVVDDIAVLVLDSGFSNNPPAAADDAAVVRAGAYRDIDVLHNDADLDNDALTIENVTAPPAHGTAVIQNGLIRYTPTFGYLGPDSFTYTIGDGRGGTATAAVSVSIEAPTAVEDDDVTLPGYPVDIRVLENDSNPDGVYSLFIVATSDPDHVAIHDGLITYTPPAGFHGRHSFTYTIGDDFGNSSTATVRVTVNSPPVAEDLIFSVPHRFTGLFTVAAPGLLAGASDADFGDAVEIIAEQRQVDFGTVTINADGSFTFDPSTFDNRLISTSFHYSIRDALGAISIAVAHLEVDNTPPVARDDYLSVPSGDRHFNQNITRRMLANDTDAEDDSLSIEVVTQPQFGQLHETEFGLIYDYTGGLTDFDTFLYRVSDGIAESEVAQATIFLTFEDDFDLDGQPEGRGLPNDGDMNRDGEYDHQQPNVTPVIDAVTGVLGVIEVSTGGFRRPPSGSLQLLNVSSLTLDEVSGGVPPPVANHSFVSPYGWFSFIVTGVPLGETVYVSIQLPKPEGFNGRFSDYYKFGPTPDDPADHWYTVDALVTDIVDPLRILFEVTDGGVGDADLTVNGNIVDPGGPVFVLIPVAGSDTYQVNEDQPLVVVAPGVLVNDTSPTGDPLTSVLVTGPAHGTHALQVDGSFTYVPAPNFNGTDSFTYKSSDGRLESEVATVTITVNPVNDAPSATISGPPVGIRGQPRSFVLDAHDVEPQDEVVGFNYAIDWNGDGNVDQTTEGPGSLAVEHVFESAGDYIVHVTAIDQHSAASAKATHAIRIAANPPHIESVVINDGHAQRSKINSITVTFDSLVSIDPGAFELQRQGTSNPIGLVVALSEQNGRTVAVLTFSGPGIIGGSLANGLYSLVVHGDKIRNASGQSLDGDGDGVAGGNRREEFFRRFGDGDGDGDVDSIDRRQFLTTLSRRAGDPDYLWYFDFNDDGRVAVIDLLAITIASLGPLR